MIYFIQEAGNPAGPIKIGFTDRQPEERLQGIQALLLVKLSILKVIEGGTAEEASLHRRFSSFRLQGEWFSPDQSLLDFINDPGLEPCRLDFIKGDRVCLKAKIAEFEARSGGGKVPPEWIIVKLRERYGVSMRFKTLYSIMQGKAKSINPIHLGYICNILGCTIEEVTVT